MITLDTGALVVVLVVVGLLLLMIFWLQVRILMNIALIWWILDRKKGEEEKND
ncbi:MAG: hypothetical protein K2I56_00960 [Muribaculaceae bacterium]|nr:hypothetical protein [Muribaculaceae bacterium]